MRVLVTGGTGGLGRAVIGALRARGDGVRVMSRRARPADIDARIEWAEGDLATGTGLVAAVAGVDAIVHAASDPTRADAVDVAGTRALAATAGRAHLLYVSIVGVDRIPVRYYRHKLAAEAIVAESGAPFSIARLTQFHGFLDWQLALLARRLPLLMPIAAGYLFQSVATEEAAGWIVSALDAGPAGRLPDFGGPEALTMSAAASAWCPARAVRKRPFAVPLFGAAARAFRGGAATVPAGERGTQTWADWLAAHPARVDQISRTGISRAPS